MKNKDLYIATIMIDVPIMASCHAEAEMLAKHPQIVEDAKKSINLAYRFNALEILSVMKKD
jgi:hypothetical protein